MCYNASMFINCNYDIKGKKVIYNGFEATHRSNPELNKTFKTNNPPQDYRNAMAYALNTSDDYITCSSSVDHFVSDGDDFGWYTNEFGEECFDYLDDLPGLEQSAQERKQSGMDSLVFYLQNTLGINADSAKIISKTLYDEFASYIVPLTLKYQAEHKQ